MLYRSTAFCSLFRHFWLHDTRRKKLPLLAIW